MKDASNTAARMFDDAFLLDGGLVEANEVERSAAASGTGSRLQVDTATL